MNQTDPTTVVLYLPAISARYLRFLKQYEGGHLRVLGPKVLDKISDEVPYVGTKGRDLWALTPSQVAVIVVSLGIFKTVRVLDSFTGFLKREPNIVMPDDDVSLAVNDRFLVGYPYVRFVSSRLRYDKMASFSEEPPAHLFSVTTEEMHGDMMSCAYKWSKKSFDWWRQIGAVLARDGEFLVGTTNKEHPSFIFDIMGDSRTPFNAGEHIDRVLTGHAERAVIDIAARRGIPTDGADIYVNTFPCRSCAVSIGQAGIKRLFFATGYSNLEAAETLLARGVELIKVEM